jgi:hypothetical protein
MTRKQKELKRYQIMWTFYHSVLVIELAMIIAIELVELIRYW